MTNPAEIQSNPEQQKPIDPALQDLAKRVEKKDQALSEKIIKIAEANAQQDAQEQRKALRSELSDHEKKAISKIAKSKEVTDEERTTADQITEPDHEKNFESALKKGGIGAAATAAIAATAGSFEGIKEAKGLGIFEKLSGAIDKVGNIWDAFMNSIESWIAGKFPSLAKMFGFEEKSKVTIDNVGGAIERVKDKGVGEVEKISENDSIKGGKYRKMTEHIFRKANRRTFDGWWSATGSALWDGTIGKSDKEKKDRSNDYAETILKSEVVRNLTFNELKKYSNNPVWIANKIKIDVSDEKIKNEYIKYAFGSIVSGENEEWMSANLSKTPDWRDISLYESMNDLYAWIGYERIEKIKTTIEWVNWSAPGDFAMKISGMMIHPTADGGYGGIVGEKIESLRSRGMSKDVVGRIFFDKEGERTIQFYRENILTTLPFKGNEHTQELMEKMTHKGWFPQEMAKMMEKFGFGDYSKNFENGEKFTMREMGILYALTHGRSDIDSMNKAERMEVYMAMLGMILERNPVSASSDLILRFVNSPNNPYITDILDFMWTQIDKAAYTGILAALNIGEDSIVALDQIREKNPTVFYGALAGIAFAVMVGYYCRTAIVTAGIVWAIIKSAWLLVGLTLAGGAVK